MSYRRAIAINGVLFAGMFLVLCFFPKAYLAGYGIEQTDSAAFITRRASPMFLGLAYMTWAIRDMAPSAGRKVVTDGAALLLIGIAVTGLYSLSIGAVGPSILVGAGVELACAAALLSVLNKPL